MSEKTEEWRAVVGFEGKYEVSNLGRVKSLDYYKAMPPSRRHPNGFIRQIQWQTILKPGLASNGYLTVNINTKSQCVQYIVASAFIGPRPDGLLVLHGDGVRTNNKSSNLRYGTAKENSQDSAAHGTKVQGSQYPTAKLNEETAAIIFALKGHWPLSKLAKFFNVSASGIHAVHSGRTWTHSAPISKNVALGMIAGKDFWH